MIVLVRHGRTEANALGLLLGRADPALDEEGRRQAGRIATGLGPLDVARVVTSPLLRCRATAAAVAAALAEASAGPGAGEGGSKVVAGEGGSDVVAGEGGSKVVAGEGGSDVVAGEGGSDTVPVEVDERWVELDYGVLDGRPLAEVGAGRWAAWRSDVTWAPEGGESLAALGERVRGACEQLSKEAAERDIVVVTHVSPIKAAVAWALGVGDEVAWRMWVAPASISRVGIGPHGPALRSFNELAHLEAPPVR